MMKVKKIFNNNLVSSINANGEEVIIYGKGIGFSKRANDTIYKDEIEKIYSVLNKGMNDKFKKLIADIPMQYINLADDIIKMFEKELNKNLSESILITLSDHLYSVVDRYTNNFLLPNTMIWEIKRLYPTEHEIALKAVEVINKELEINLSSDEAGFITFHIISAELNEEIPRIIDMTEFINDVLNIVKYHFQIVFDENTLTYSRFITHLQFLAQSIFALDKEDSRTNTLSETSLSEVILVTYPKSYKGVIKVDDYIYKKYHYHMTKAEQSYLTIHIQRLLDES